MWCWMLSHASGPRIHMFILRSPLWTVIETGPGLLHSVVDRPHGVSLCYQYTQIHEPLVKEQREEGERRDEGKKKMLWGSNVDQFGGEYIWNKKNIKPCIWVVNVQDTQGLVLSLVLPGALSCLESYPLIGFTQIIHGVFVWSFL